MFVQRGRTQESQGRASRRLSVLLQPWLSHLKMNRLSSGIIWGSLCNFRNICASDPSCPLLPIVCKQRRPGLLGWGGGGTVACFLGNGRKTAWGQLLTACLTCIYLHWPSSISRKSIGGPAVRHWVTLGSLVACDRKVFPIGLAGPQLSALFRQKCFFLPTSGIWVEHHSHRIAQENTSLVLFFFFNPESTSIFSAIFRIWKIAEKLSVLSSWFIGGWDLSLISN